MDKKSDFYIAVSRAFSSATKCKVLGVCLDCFKTFKLRNNE